MSWTKIANAHLESIGHGAGWKMVEQEFSDRTDSGCLFLVRGNLHAYVHISEGAIEDVDICTCDTEPVYSHNDDDDDEDW